MGAPYTVSQSLRHVVLALGSNMGDKLKNFRDALQLLGNYGIQVKQRSRLYETAAAYVEDQPAFLNMAVVAATHLQPTPLLHTLKEVEGRLGREQGALRWGPRPLDIDIIFYEDWQLEDKDLQVPHARWRERGFVKAPLGDLEAPAGLTPSPLAFRLDEAHSVWQQDGGEEQVGGTDLHCVMPLPHGRGLWAWQRKSWVMGILNTTPDSFSDGGEATTLAAAVAKAEALVRDGADIIDIGGQSTRPGAALVSPDMEMSRVVPVIRALRACPSTSEALISVDTFYARVAREAVAAGAHFVNDVSGGSLDPAMLPEVADMQVPFVAMHMRGDPATMQLPKHTTYHNVVAEVAKELGNAAERALAAGIEPWCLILDPGIGFAKTGEANCEVMAGLRKLRGQLPRAVRGCPLLLGPSRKAFIGRITGKEAKARDVASAVAATVCLWEGANIVRMHNAAVGRDTARMVDAIKAASLRLP